MIRIAALAAALAAPLALAAPAQAQLAPFATASTQKTYGANWTMGQDLHDLTAPTRSALTREQARRAQRQARLHRPFTGLGRPVSERR